MLYAFILESEGQILYYNGFNLIKNEWWLEKVDDYFDNTYCDIYAKIKVPEGFEKSYLKSSEDE